MDEAMKRENYIIMRNLLLSPADNIDSNMIDFDEAQ